MSSKPDQIVLVGLPGSGKTTVGPLLAGRLDWRFIDFDPVIEAEAGLSIREIFARNGEAEFRRLESELTRRLASEPNLVAAPGAGWFLRNELPRALAVWLKVDAAEAIERMGDDVAIRPLLRQDPLAGMNTLLAERASYYERAALHIETNGKTADAVAEEIAVALKGYGNQEE